MADEGKAMDDPRVYFAAERTLPAAVDVAMGGISLSAVRALMRTSVVCTGADAPILTQIDEPN